MLKKLFLSSFFKETANIFADFQKDLHGKTVTFIPTAAKVEAIRFYVNSGRKALMKMGMTVDELEISTASADEIETKLKGNDFIYITGGNTFFLLQELKRTGADRLIIDEVNSGKLYIGESAGAIITSPNAEYVKAMDSIKKAPGLTSFDALGLVDFYTVPHYRSAPFKKIAEKIIADYSSGLNLTPISNSDVICVENGKVTMRKN